MSSPHKGRHHYENCGEYRPLDPKTECPACPAKCPGCGAYYVLPKPPVRRCPTCGQTAPPDVTDEQFDAHVARHNQGT